MRDAALKGMSWWQDIFIDYASIQFTQTSTSCGSNADQSACYAAKMQWTSSGATGRQYRPCLVPQLPAPDNAAASSNTLPKNLFGPGSIIAIEVSFSFVPSIGMRFLPSITIARSVYVKPRYASVINFDTTNHGGIVSECLF